MPVISITIIASADQTLPGIPNTVSLLASEPASIFYTLDGSDPNTYSPIYFSPILMPQNLLNVILKVFATNQIDSSAIITQTYTAIKGEITTMVGDRLPHAAVTNLNTSSTGNSLFPFGTDGPNTDFQYLNPGDAGITVYDQSKSATSSGFDADGYPAGFTNKPIDNFKYKQIYSTVNSEGEVTPGVGNLPAKVTILKKSTPNDYNPEKSSFSDKIFNPRALVIYQDAENEDPTNPVNINRPYFSLEDPEVVRNGNLLYNAALDSPPPMGGFVNRSYNARTGEMTHAYFDSTVNRWIFSKFKFQPTTQNVGGLSNMVFSRAKTDGRGGVGFVYQWYPFLYRTLI